MLRERLDGRRTYVEVTSAGFVTEDRPAPKEVLDVLDARGLDVRSHRSRRLGPTDLGAADLVLCMERRHVREIAVLDREAFARSFTLPDLARRAQLHGPRGPSEGVSDWLRRISPERRPADVLGVASDDEVADPYGRSAAAYRRAAQTIDDLLDVVVRHLFP